MELYTTQLENWKSGKFIHDELPAELLPIPEHLVVYENYCNQIAEFFGAENTFLEMCCDGDIYIFVKPREEFNLIYFSTNLHWNALTDPDFDENQSVAVCIKKYITKNEKLEKFAFIFGGNFEKCLNIVKFWAENPPSCSYYSEQVQ